MNHCQSTKEYFNSIANKWDTMCHHDSEKISAILTLANIKKDSRVLDIATGTGVLIPHLLKTEPTEVKAIDLSELMIAQAQKNHDDNQVRFQVANFYEFDQTGFDFAIAYSAYPHFWDKEGFVRHLAESLNSQGRFMIAHSESKETINGRHSGDQVRKVSASLKDAMTESNYFKAAFDIDILVDTDEMYIISGKKK
ncbi:class I SAM-dependent methyltransferase [Acetobacterium wieringae]|uniref:Class I SAM-dependent methyltransferase n=1 Tax=Acetobacterium wieringae TaxID=52694 RepID=A0A1F2PD44_9FIRM|nr:class I SAM-dependent methyltransferase [Acetobacterium wieringae]OFV69330.1 ubiquinone/menaquinone biosynthesis C-methyltransferase UbiE [Acetobacterium wieringae]TYC87891.1 class I SAM-dependent methyltransferase [Acetobacterium wieringae]URN83583.1 class I SAM-dependent methyltransferase [Acetobacterium wieringae]UYO62015.1 class I SAM-dependent methyltransferase [Acetobacterium wieringae]